MSSVGGGDMAVSYVIGNVVTDYGFNSEALIVQQNNCTARKIRKGSLAYSIAETLNFDPYARRAARGNGIFPNLAKKEHREKMGDVYVFDDGIKKARVACLFAQFRMGSANSPFYLQSQIVDKEYKTTPDDKEARLRAFQQCLEKLSSLIDDRVRVIVFPEKIGCNMAGGDWPKYKAKIEQFATLISKMKKNVSIIICKLQ